MSRQPSALGYALPLIIAIGVVGGFTAYKVSSAKASIGMSDAADDQPLDAGADQPSPGKVRWLKGQTHAHTNKGPDSIEPVESVLAFYADAGFDFVVLTDHNHVTVAQGPPGLLVIAGAELTQSRDRCDPMPEGALQCAMHMNALFVDPTKTADAFLEPPTSSTLDVYRAELAAAKQLGGLAQLNHPNYHYTAADPDLLVTLSDEGLRFIEVMNEASALNSDGDEKHPNVEALWDQALMKGAKLYAIASDDAHNYSDAEAARAKGEKPAVVNQGFIYVRAKKDPRSIRDAMERGDFYASNGVELADIAVGRAPPIGRHNGAVHAFIRVAAHHQNPVIRLVVDGEIIREVRGHEASVGVEADFSQRPLVLQRYVRAIIEAEGRRALTQPFFPAEWTAPPHLPNTTTK